MQKTNTLSKSFIQLLSFLIMDRQVKIMELVFF